ncbi:MAG: hypothetical protein JSR62_08985 [Nitrospira sp.]|nr:hypothetical protein [Nitrospira sp.]
MYTLSSRIEQVLARAIRIEPSELDAETLRKVTTGVIRLSDMFTRGDSGIGTSYLDERELRQAYLAYYVPVNLAKVQILLTELESLLTEHKGDEFRVLDVGGGPGTGALAVLDWACSASVLSPETLRMTVLDRSPAVLQTCAELWQSYLAALPRNPPIPLQTIECHLERPLPEEIRSGSDGQGFHLIVVQNVLSELYAGSINAIEKRTALAAHFLSLLATGGSLILIEPALRATSRGLHEVRDRLLAQHDCSIYSPCLHDKSCPALVRPDDWCHEERHWDRPAWIAQIDQAVGFIKDALKFSYVVLRKDGKTLVPRNESYHRVVSELRVMKGEKRVWLCDADGRSEVGRQDKDRSSSNAAFEQYHRGAIVHISEIVRKERKGRPSTVGRILPQGTTEVIRPA